MARKSVPEESGGDAPVMFPDGAVPRRPEQEHVQVLNPTPASTLATSAEGYRYQTARNPDGSTSLVPPPRSNSIVRSAVRHEPAPAVGPSEDQRLAYDLSERLEEAVTLVAERQAAVLSGPADRLLENKEAYDRAVASRDDVAARLEEVQSRLNPGARVKYFVVEGDKEKRAGGHLIRPGKVLDSLNYDPKELRRGGVRLKEIRAEERDQY